MQGEIDMNNGLYEGNIRRVIQQEGEKLLQIADNLDYEKVNIAVELLLNCKGKILLMGVGKSGFVARKIAATFTSIGTPAIYLNATDAMHGDIGIVSPSDIAIVISNSGESHEIIEVLPFIKNRNVSIIALVSNAKSTLAENADIVIDLMVKQEACQYNLVPTTSAAAVTAFGDALALTLMEAKNIGPENYALNHPAGRLGKRLTLRVKDLMHVKESNPTIYGDSNLYEIIKAISDGGLGAVSVIAEDGHLIGIVTDGDIRRAVQNNLPNNIYDLYAEQVMTKDPIKVTQDILAFEAMNIMENRISQISVLPVVDNNNVSIGMIRLHDIVRSGL